MIYQSSLMSADQFDAARQLKIGGVLKVNLNLKRFYCLIMEPVEETQKGRQRIKRVRDRGDKDIERESKIYIEKRKTEREKV
jgi:hypothetical protein